MFGAFFLPYNIKERVFKVLSLILLGMLHFNWKLLDINFTVRLPSLN